MTSESDPAADCFLCSKPAKLSCSDCDVVFCSETHGKYHRSNVSFDGDDDADSTNDVSSDGSASNCYPYVPVFKEGIGRCLVATRDIRAGETIFFEPSALALGPNPESSEQCLICRKKVSRPGRTVCSVCAFPMCSQDCSSAHPTLPECPILARMTRTAIDPVRLYETVLPLRLLLLPDEPHRNLLETFMDHREERSADQNHWERCKEEVVSPITEAGHFDEEEAWRAVGVAEVNNYEVYNPGDCGYRGVFPVTSLASHSCTPNARLATGRTGGCPNRCVAAVDIGKGEEISISYVHLHMSTALRRERLLDNWYFACCCDRCADPTERGTFLGAVRCRNCSKGHLLPKAPLDSSSPWHCQDCQSGVASKEAAEIVRSLLEEKDSLDRGDLDAYLEFLDKADRFLHENHYVLTAARRWLLPLYCRRRVNNEKSSSASAVTDAMLERKVQMCERYLFVLDRVEPGLNKNRGRVLYELADSRISLRHRLFQKREVTTEEFASELRHCRELSLEAAGCLRFDDGASFEGYVCRASKQLAGDIADMIKFLS